jgi:hypothetical protein
VRPFAGEGVRCTIAETEANDRLLGVARDFLGGAHVLSLVLGRHKDPAPYLSLAGVLPVPCARKEREHRHMRVRVPALETRYGGDPAMRRCPEAIWR